MLTAARDPNNSDERRKLKALVNYIKRNWTIPSVAYLPREHGLSMPKTSRDEKSSKATAARGSSALTDGVRWQAHLEPLRGRDNAIPIPTWRMDYLDTHVFDGTLTPSRALNVGGSAPVVAAEHVPDDSEPGGWRTVRVALLVGGNVIWVELEHQACALVIIPETCNYQQARNN